MIKNTLQYCATDKEIHDALMSARKKISEKVLLEIAKDRGIFLSNKETREDLIGVISLLPHDYHDLNSLLEQSENSGRQEKITSVTLAEELTVEEIKDILKEYADEAPADERVNFHPKGTNQVNVNVNYSEIDYGKTRLIQRTPKEAGIEFHTEDKKTIIRMPANERVKKIFSKLKDKIDFKKKKEVQAIRIEIGEFESPSLRTTFFTSLISTLNGFTLSNVTSVKVERLKAEPEDDELVFEDDQETEEAKQVALALVQKVALKGETLLASEEYQSLSRKGFFITSIIWRSKLKKPPYPMIEFEAAFEEPLLGKGFKYFIRGAYNMVDQHYTKTIRPIDALDKEKYLTIIEETAANTINDLQNKAKIDVNVEKTQGVST